MACNLTTQKAKDKIDIIILTTFIRCTNIYVSLITYVCIYAINFHYLIRDLLCYKLYLLTDVTKYVLSIYFHIFHLLF